MIREEGIDSRTAEAEANKAFSTMVINGIDYDELESFICHQLKYSQCMSQGDVVSAMHTLLKSKGILRMRSMEQFMRQVVKYFFRILRVEVKDGLRSKSWDCQNQSEECNIGSTSRGSGLYDTTTPCIKNGTFCVDPEYAANQSEAENSIFGQSRKVGLIIETIPVISKDDASSPVQAVVMYDTGSVTTYVSWIFAPRHATYMVKLKEPCVAMSING